MREELEDLAFKETNSEAYQSINKRIKFLRKNNENFIKDTISNIEKKIGCNKFLITGREKKIYSTWKKMSKKAIPLEKVADINAFRIITNTKEDCYKVRATDYLMVLSCVMSLIKFRQLYNSTLFSI